MIPQLNPQEFLPILVAFLVSFFFSLGIVLVFITPRIVRAKTERTQNLQSLQNQLHAANARNDSLYNQFRNLQIAFEYTPHHKKWELEYKKLAGFYEVKLSVMSLEYTRDINSKVEKISEDRGVVYLTQQVYKHLRV